MFVRLWKLVHKRTKEIKMKGSYRIVVIHWEGLADADNYDIERVS